MQLSRWQKEFVFQQLQLHQELCLQHQDDDVVTAYLKERKKNNNIEHKGYCHKVFLLGFILLTDCIKGSQQHLSRQHP
jgi:hypothetical protein